MEIPLQKQLTGNNPSLEGTGIGSDPIGKGSEVPPTIPTQNDVVLTILPAFKEPTDDGQADNIGWRLGHAPSGRFVCAERGASRRCLPRRGLARGVVD